MTLQNRNSGIAVINDSPIGPQATIAATGLGRSGTTMVARVMFDLGLPMWDRLTPQSCEDKTIQVMIKSGDLDGFGALCRERTQLTPRWGFKVPALRGQMSEAGRKMVEPRFIVIFRDILAVALRNEMSAGSEFFDALHRATTGYTSLVKSLRELQAPVLLISYEKAMQHPEATVQRIAEFCGLPKSDAEIREIAASTVVNGDLRYLGVAS